MIKFHAFESSPCPVDPVIAKRCLSTKTSSWQTDSRLAGVIVSPQRDASEHQRRERKSMHSKLHVESMAQSDRHFSTLSKSCSWMLRDPAFSDVGTDTSTVRSGPGSFVPTRGCSSCKVALLLWERLGTVRRAAMPLPFLLHGLPHSKKLGCSRIARQESENAESRRWVWLSCAPDIASPPQARSGECCRLSPS